MSAYIFITLEAGCRERVVLHPVAHALVNLPARPTGVGTPNIVVLCVPDSTVNGAPALADKPVDDELGGLGVRGEVLGVHVTVVRHDPQDGAC